MAEGARARASAQRRPTAVHAAPPGPIDWPRSSRRVALLRPLGPLKSRRDRPGFSPDIISSDLHIGGVNGIVYDLPTCLTKFMAMGMNLSDVVRAATATPAAALNLRESLFVVSSAETQLRSWHVQYTAI